MKIKSSITTKIFRMIAFFSLAMLASAALLLAKHATYVSNPLDIGREFNAEIIGKTFNLFDLGIADINQDGWLDIYTTNHGSLQKILINNQGHDFSDSLAALNLSQSKEFPNSESSIESKPSLNKPGLYIFWQRENLNIKSYRLSGSLSGVIEFLEDTRLQDIRLLEQQAQVNIREIIQPSGEHRVKAEFTIFPGGYVKFNSTLPPTQFAFDDPSQLKNIFVGSEKQMPATNPFVIQLSDRHSMAWLDINADKKPDVFIARGGMRGMMKQYSSKINDELFIATSAVFENKIDRFGIAKNGCPGRQSAWTDIDGDEKADLYIACGQGKPGEDFPNLLYHQTDSGKFSEQAQSYGLDFAGSGSFVWLDVDQDRDLDLFWADHDTYWLYINKNGKFKAQKIASAPSDVKKLAIADYDNDGDLDLFAVSASQSSLFVNSGSSLAAVAPPTLGLPVQVQEASWVDIDRDGLMDLHTLPNGFYQQKGNHRFTATNQMAQKVTNYPRPVWTAWFDVDNNGSRDLLLAIEDQPSLMQRALQRGLSIWRQKILRRAPEKPPLPTSTLILYHHKPAKQHWLELDLFNKAEANAIGASVTVATAQGQQTQQVGQAEGSLFSQGHYRLYFEFGKQPKPKWLRVNWPDGSSQELTDIAADRAIQVTQGT